MLEVSDNPRAVIGGNNPPPPVESHALHINDLLDEAKNFLDGEPISTQGQADAVGELLKRIREARAGADEQRAIEKKPHDDAGKAVQAVWKPLLERCDLAATTAKNALAPWRLKLEAEQKAAAEQARIAAEEAAAKLRAAHKTTKADDLEGQMIQADLEREAEDAAKAAKRAASAKVATSGTRLVSVWNTTLTDPIAALKHYKARQPEALKDWLLEQAQADVRNGARVIPGFEILETKEAR